ncbi:MAG: urea carboxylase, partial [Chloroflexi bacterium]|nr:urea carboxylase [Chloroflexota bacterium]
APGKYVELVAAMDILVLISNCPQLNNPCSGFNPTPIELTIWRQAD